MGSPDNQMSPKARALALVAIEHTSPGLLDEDTRARILDDLAPDIADLWELHGELTAPNTKSAVLAIIIELQDRALDKLEVLQAPGG
jgi:hypothetical protein